MGSSQSIQEEEEEEEDEADDEAKDGRNPNPNGIGGMKGHLLKKILEQEPEILPCYPSASPLSPQQSSSGTPNFESSIKVWDPYNFLVPPPPPLPPLHFTRNFSFDSIDDEQMFTEVFLINHGEFEMNLKPELVAGRCPQSSLTPLGRRQARALAVFLNSQGVRFNSVYTSPLSRARATAISVCQEMKFSEEEIQSSEEVSEMSWGEWEGCHLSEIYTPELQDMMESQQPDFSAPNGGESLRNVEFRVARFLNLLVLGLHAKKSHRQTDSINANPNPNIHLLPVIQQQQRQSNLKKTFGKSRLMFMTTTTTSSSNSTITSNSDCLNGAVNSVSSSTIGVFTHSWPIKCAVTGLLGCGPVMSQKICVDDSSITVLHHSWRNGWKLKRLNDTAHLRLL